MASAQTFISCINVIYYTAVAMSIYALTWWLCSRANSCWITVQQMWCLLRKTNRSSGRRGRPISKETWSWSKTEIQSWAPKPRTTLLASRKLLLHPAPERLIAKGRDWRSEANYYPARSSHRKIKPSSLENGGPFRSIHVFERTKIWSRASKEIRNKNGCAVEVQQQITVLFRSRPTE
jgi:hypothetical protein